MGKTEEKKKTPLPYRHSAACTKSCAFWIWLVWAGKKIWKKRGERNKHRFLVAIQQVVHFEFGFYELKTFVAKWPRWRVHHHLYSHTHTYTYTYAYTYTYTYTYTHKHKHAHAHVHTHAHSHTMRLSPLLQKNLLAIVIPLILSLTHTHILSVSLSVCLSVSLSLSLSLYLFLSLFLPHTHTHEHMELVVAEEPVGDCNTMGWLRWVGSIKLQVSFAEYHLFYRALLQKRPIILRSLLIVATPYLYSLTHNTYTFSHTNTHPLSLSLSLCLSFSFRYVHTLTQ